MEEDFAEFGFKTEQKVTGKMPKIIVVRHAESIANTQGIYQGQTYDTDLSPLGKKQAEALAVRLKEVGITKIVSSPLKRAYQTAFEVSRTLDFPIETDNFIIETNHGEWEGKTKEWIGNNYPEIYSAWLTKPSQVVFPQGEAFQETLNRVGYFLQNAQQLTDNTLLVTHDNIVRIMVTLANGWTLDDIWTHDIEPAALNFFEVNIAERKNKLKLLQLNDNKHLREIRSDIKKHAL